jgi:hypothetical protein
MIEFMLAAGLTCADSKHIISNMKQFGERNAEPPAFIQELIDVVKDDNPECFNERSE